MPSQCSHRTPSLPDYVPQGTLRTDHYQCVKDMGRLNRSLERTVLVDDTPLAFLHQPDNGVPVLGYRGDPDDRLLLEAVLPLIQVRSSKASHTNAGACTCCC